LHLNAFPKDHHVRIARLRVAHNLAATDLSADLLPASRNFGTADASHRLRRPAEATAAGISAAAAAERSKVR
jgi:hypothetical protein